MGDGVLQFFHGVKPNSINGGPTDSVSLCMFVGKRKHVTCGSCFFM